MVLFAFVTLLYYKQVMDWDGKKIVFCVLTRKVVDLDVDSDSRPPISRYNKFFCAYLAPQPSTKRTSIYEIQQR